MQLQHDKIKCWRNQAACEQFVLILVFSLHFHSAISYYLTYLAYCLWMPVCDFRTDPRLWWCSNSQIRSFQHECTITTKITNMHYDKKHHHKISSIRSCFVQLKKQASHIKLTNVSSFIKNEVDRSLLLMTPNVG